MDFDDSPEEAAFRERIRAWLAENNPGLPASSTDDEYWAHQAEWHWRAVRRGVLRADLAAKYGGHELPPVYEVIVDEELAAAGAPPKPEPRLPDPGDHAARERRDVRPLPARPDQRS